MNYFKKNVRYLKFCEDIKLMDNDQHNARLAIVFCGKERLIHIFDSSPYRDYLPIQISSDKEEALAENSSMNIPPANIDYPPMKTEEVDIKKLFIDISNDHQQQSPQVIVQNNQEYIIFHPNQLQKPCNEPKLDISKFDLFFEAAVKKMQVKLDMKKPKIRTRLLSVIQTNTIKGIEWFSFQKDCPLLLVVNIDNFIGVYKRRQVDNSKQTRINSTFLQTQPFGNFPEEWAVCGSASQSIPTKDYYLKPSGENIFKLYTIHANNNIYFWLIIQQGDSLKITPNFSISFDHCFIIDNILVNANETFLYCFNGKGMQIYKLSSVLPFNLVYVYWYEEVNDSNKKKQGIKRLMPLSSFSEDIDETLIDVNENVTREELKFFKDLQKPVFTLTENVLFIQLFNANDNTYSLMYFDTQGLMRIFKDITFFEKCRKGKEKTLMRKFFESEANFSFALSPSLYLRNTSGGLSIDSEIGKDQLLASMHQVLIISNGDDNTFYSLPAIMEPDYALSPTTLHSFYRVRDSNEDEYKLLILWIERNTIIFSSLKFLFSIVKYCNEADTFGLPVSYDKIKLLLSNK